ncbi:MAG: hypothetical protein PVF58_06515 [Candidatus Methanofastidiosia archaeon]|jgi:hypothetical protein
MKKRKKILAVSSVVILFFALTCVTAQRAIEGTPLFTYRMEQASSKMHFLPTEKNSFDYKTEKSSILNCNSSSGYCGMANMANLRCSEGSTCPDTCLDTCPHTCPYTCPNTCQGWTCNNSTCCSSTCWETCGTCQAATCECTCVDSTCNAETACTCNVATCGGTCGTCSTMCIATCGLPC